VDQIEIRRPSREVSGRCNRLVGQEVRIVHAPRQRSRLAEHLAIEQRQFRIDAGLRPQLPARSLHPQRYAFGEDDEQDLILEAVPLDPGGDGRLNRGPEVGSADAVGLCGFQADDVSLRDVAELNVVIGDLCRGLTSAIDDEEDAI
jgi:hypothetical protein